MHADVLRTAVANVVKILKHAGIAKAVDQYRISKGDERIAAAARLGQAGAVLVEKIDSMSPAERLVIKCLHLESLGSTQYWQQLMSGKIDAKRHQAEIVRLASRVMFSSSHLPAIVSLLSSIPANEPAFEANTRQQEQNPLLAPLEAGEGALFIRLTDAGERASDPDRVARAIDGVDMLYSACASIARRPSIDLRLDSVQAKENRDRDFRFTGDKDSVSAVFAVIDSIPGALAEINPEQDIDLDAVVRSLAIFKDLNTLASLGTFSGKDLKDISETMHQGALLTLESGVILIDEQMVAQQWKDEVRSQSIDQSETAIEPSDKAVQVGALASSAAESDEHYNRYLRERDAMVKSQAAIGNGSMNGHSGVGIADMIAKKDVINDDQTRKDAVDALLKSLDQSRSS